MHYQQRFLFPPKIFFHIKWKNINQLYNNLYTKDIAGLQFPRSDWVHIWQNSPRNTPEASEVEIIQKTTNQTTRTTDNDKKKEWL